MIEQPFPLPLSAYASPLSGQLIDALWLRTGRSLQRGRDRDLHPRGSAHLRGRAICRSGAPVAAATDAAAVAAGDRRCRASRAEFLHFLGEVEVVFGLWIVPLMVAIVVAKGWEMASHYVNETVNFTEALFVVVIMASPQRGRSSRSRSTRCGASPTGAATPAAWWLAILTSARCSARRSRSRPP